MVPRISISRAFAGGDPEVAEDAFNTARIAPEVLLLEAEHAPAEDAGRCAAAAS